MSSESLTQKPTLPCYCTECAYTSPQSLGTYVSWHDDNSLEKLDPRDDTAPASTGYPVYSLSRYNRNDPQYPGNSYGSGGLESRNSIECNPSVISSPTRTYNCLREADSATIPIQDINPSCRGPQLQYLQETKRVEETRNYRLGNPTPSIPSALTSTREPNLSRRAQIPPESLETQVSYSAAKPPDRVEPPSIPSVPIQERSQPQETQVSSNLNKPRDSAKQPTRDRGQDRSVDASKTDTRPHLMHGTPSQMDTQYVNMLLALDDIPTLHNIYAGFFNWILLAGFILFPGTFTSLKNLGASGPVEQRLVHAVTSVPLFVIAWLCTGIGVTGMLWLWWRWRRNYVWALNQIFIPGAMNSLAGLISTLANIFGVQHGELLTNSKITIIVTAVSTGVLGILTAIYSLWVVKRVKSQHDKEVGKERAGKHGEGVVDPKRKVHA